MMAMWDSDSRPQSSDLTCKREMGKVKYIYQQQEKQAFVDSLFVFFYPYRTVIFV
ncbi:hypothetical protein [Bacillus cereus]|uniref:hypothetical protein n=1 Tax=Bacillus cereus TaxID=1396 RepID=UPI0024BCE8B9|nr:hypothetical protein [Bacillus cereus]